MVSWFCLIMVSWLCLIMVFEIEKSYGNLLCMMRLNLANLNECLCCVVLIWSVGWDLGY
jgi:hypothetical protein